MGSIYLDNASTTFPKPRAVADAMYGFLTQTGSTRAIFPRWRR